MKEYKAMRTRTCLNKLLVSLCLAIVLITLTSFASFAQNTSTGNTVPAPADINRENLKNTLKEEVKTQKEAWSQKRTEIRSQVMGKIKSNSLMVVKRYQAVIARYETLIARIEKRIAQEKVLGRDTSAVEASLSEVKATVEKIKPSIDLAASKLSGLSENSSEEEIKVAIKEARDILKTQKENLVTLKQSIRKLIADVHALSVESKGTNGTAD